MAKHRFRTHSKDTRNAALALSGSRIGLGSLAELGENSKPQRAPKQALKPRRRPSTGRLAPCR